MIAHLSARSSEAPFQLAYLRGDISGFLEYLRQIVISFGQTYIAFVQLHFYRSDICGVFHVKQKLGSISYFPFICVAIVVACQQ